MPPKKQKSAMAQRNAAAEQAKKKQRTRRIVWFSTVGILLILIVVVLSIKPKASAASFDYENLPRLGQADAPIKIVEFGDFKCPACKTANDVIKPHLISDYINSGKVAFYFMNLPFISPDSTTAALAAQSVFHQSKDDYWTYFDALYHNQPDEKLAWATPDYLVDLAKQANLSIDFDLLRKDIENQTYIKEVNEHQSKASKLGVSGTPTYYINGVEYLGRYDDYAEFEQQVKAALGE
ncbi:MAG TPA: DsbA family protein [Paenibacillus sp.]|jgi:protein-disulfide isomerase